MAIYLISVDSWGYDCYDSVLVRASSEKAARQHLADINFGGDEAGYYGNRNGIWQDPKRSICERVEISGETDIIISSFNAG